MELRLSVDDKIVSAARRRAEAMGTTLEQLVNEYLAQMPDPDGTLEGIERWRQVNSAKTSEKAGHRERP